MMNHPTRSAARPALLIHIFTLALMLCLAPGKARALEVDPPLLAASRAALQTASLQPLATAVTGKELPVAPPRLRTLIAPKLTPDDLNEVHRIRGLKVTRNTARRKLRGLKPRLVKLLIKVQDHFGRPLHIISGCRSKKHNRRVGGARRSQHLHCNAADFQVPGVSKYKLARYLKRMPGRGGVGLYCRSSYVHLDIGPKRQWHWSCKKKRRKYKKRRARRKVAKLNRNYKQTRALNKRKSKRSKRRTRTASRD